jgi:hypothetical protein
MAYETGLSDATHNYSCCNSTHLTAFTFVKEDLASLLALQPMPWKQGALLVISVLMAFAAGGAFSIQFVMYFVDCTKIFNQKGGQKADVVLKAEALKAKLEAQRAREMAQGSRGRGRGRGRGRRGRGRGRKKASS